MWLTREDLPDTIRIEDRCYRIDTDFRSWIRFELILLDDSIDPYYKTSILINALEIDPAIQRENQEDILRALFSFYRMGKPSKKGKPCKDIPYRFDFDIDLIYAAFMQQYHIDLLTVNLHWYEFKSLFDGLTENTQLIKVIGYRTTEIDKMPKEQRKEALRLKEFWKIPNDFMCQENDRTPQEIEAELLARIEKEAGDKHGYK
ncbi:bacteriophage Gp15 family protein [[Clostridium] innocuum]|nr:bacteriophage Gp15 family protein [[Clostridium] innocuum]